MYYLCKFRVKCSGHCSADLWWICHIRGKGSCDTDLMSAMMAFLHLHLSESSPASCDERPQSEQATRKFAFSTLISFRWSYTSLQVTLLLRTSSENTFFPYSFVFPTIIFSIICFASALAGRLAFSIRRSLWQEVNSNINIVWAFKTNNNNKKKNTITDPNWFGPNSVHLWDLKLTEPGFTVNVLMRLKYIFLAHMSF